MSERSLAELSVGSERDQVDAMPSDLKPAHGAAAQRGLSYPPFSEAYFRSVYRDYDRQNPPAKLRHYSAQQDCSNSTCEAPAIHDIGCAFGRFLGAVGTG